MKEIINFRKQEIFSVAWERFENYLYLSQGISPVILIGYYYYLLLLSLSLSNRYFLSRRDGKEKPAARLDYRGKLILAPMVKVRIDYL